MDDATLAEAIIARAWQQLDELTRTGVTKLDYMEIRADDRNASTYINTLRALARLKPPKGRRMAIPEDFRAPDTRGGEAQSTHQEMLATSANTADSTSTATTPVRAASDVAGGEGTQVTAVNRATADRGQSTDRGNINTSPSRHSRKKPA